MWTSSAIVQFIPQTNCFAHVNEKFVNTYLGNNRNNACVKLTWEDQNAILWCVTSNVPDGVIGINSLFAKRLNITEGLNVLITGCNPPSVLNSVSIVPETDDDYEILEANYNKLQSCLLDQLKIIIENQRMVLWVSPSLSINILSKSSSILKEYTEVTVLTSSDNIDFNKLSENSQRVISEKSDNTINYFYEMKNFFSKYATKKHLLIMKVLNVKDKDILNSDNLVHNYLYVPEDKFNDVYHNKVFLLKCMNPSHESNNSTSPETMFVKLKSIDCHVNSQINIWHSNHIPVVVPNYLKNKLKIQTGDIFILEEFSEKYFVPETIELSQIYDRVECEDLQILFKSYILSKSVDDQSVIINDMDVMELDSKKNIHCQIQLHPKSIKYTSVNGDVLRKCKVIINKEKIQPINSFYPDYEQFDFDKLCVQVDCFNKIIKNCVDVIKANVEMKLHGMIENQKNMSHILLLGNAGSGKTTLSNVIVKNCKVWSKTINCRLIKGRKDIIETFQNVIRSCEERAPSILICDDIESIFASEKEGVPAQELTYFESQANIVKGLLHDALGVITIMTASSLDDLHSVFKSSKGDLLYSKVFTIPELVQDERICLLKTIIDNSLYESGQLDDDDYLRMSLYTEGMTVRDLVDYTVKNIFKSIKDTEYYNRSWKFSPQITSNSSKDNNLDIWEEIGGLLEARKKLTEIIYWPLKYPGLFPKQPGGILLFGPPGTGKSLIGHALSKLSEISFICVKGPELLSKYIGQSEQSVRNLFKRAEKKKPCIIFFDEFDSLASKRGHDSTGVTDRVVNQLLTQLDGVEGAIKGVTVIAATSRPDLLDGALLRPGRFDTYIHCTLPTQMERLEIFKIFSSTLPLASDVDLDELAQITENFTGADIKSILSTTQIACIEEQLMQSLEADDKNTVEFCVTQKHIMDALMETRPSLNHQQLIFYDKIYERFLKKPSINSDSYKNVNAKQRATLA